MFLPFNIQYKGGSQKAMTPSICCLQYENTTNGYQFL